MLYKPHILVWIPSGFTPLSNEKLQTKEQVTVWIPSGFTPLSNLSCNCIWCHFVWIPSGFTPLSNPSLDNNACVNVWIPSGFTPLSNTTHLLYLLMLFEYPLDLHHSQTLYSQPFFCRRLNTLWIYTTLKPPLRREAFPDVWIPSGFTPLSNQTSGKIFTCFVWIPSGFTPLSNLKTNHPLINQVWIPSGFTPLSNLFLMFSPPISVWIPSGFTPLSNTSIRRDSREGFEYPLDLHHSQTIHSRKF